MLGRFHVEAQDVPAWIREHPRLNYVLAKWLATSPDPVERKRVADIYREARARRARGEDVVVDHIEPLCSDWVCGLHHAANLEIIDDPRNRRKSNGNESLSLIPFEVEPYQRRLL